MGVLDGLREALAGRSALEAG